MIFTTNKEIIDWAKMMGTRYLPRLCWTESCIMLNVTLSEDEVIPVQTPDIYRQE